jgi:predicted P-loop ATPase
MDETRHVEGGIMSAQPPQSTVAAPPTAKSASYITALQNMGYHFRLNDCDDRLELNGDRYGDVEEATVLTRLYDLGFRGKDRILMAILAHAGQNRYHPIKDYLNGLKYDGGKHIEKLSNYFDNPDGHFETWLKRWLIGAVRRVFDPGHQNRVLVLDGPQNIGKSKFVEWLIPSHLKRKHFLSAPVDPNSRDCMMHLWTKWIWEISEFGSTTRKADVDALKFFLTLEQVNARKVFGHYDLTKPALSSFIGTINNVNGVLSDVTGNRRFMFTKIKDIDWQGYTQNVNPDDVWAEAVMLWLQGEPADLTQDEAHSAEATNESYMVVDLLEDIILKLYDVDLTQASWFEPSASILAKVGELYKGPSSGLGRKIAEIMKKLGCEPAVERYTLDVLDSNGARITVKKQGRGYRGLRPSW